jgi:hypothetical protein
MVAIEQRRKLRLVGTGKLLLRCTCTRGPSGTVYDGERDPQCLWGFQEVLYEGAAGTGKTFADSVRVHAIGTKYPQARMLILRETRESLRESFQPLFESFVIGLDSEILQRGGSRDHRTTYDYLNGPVSANGERTNGAHIKLGGVDRIELYLSTDWDLVLFLEATNERIAEHHWNTIKTRMRGRGIPHPHCQYPDGIVTDGEHAGKTVSEVLTMTERFSERDVRRNGVVLHVHDGEDDYGTPLFWRQMVAECNPSIVHGENHWLVRRFEQSRGQMVRVTATHRDNPAIDHEYLEGLRSLPEPYRSVYYEGKWMSVQGRCWKAYDPKRHIVRGLFERDSATGGATLVIDSWRTPNGQPQRLGVKSVVAGFDWAIGHAGSLQVGAVSACGKLFRIAEVHFHDRGIDWWAEKVKELVDLYRIEAILCDPSARAIWELFNERLGHRAQGRKVGQICQAADNTRQTKDWVQGGIDLVNTMFAQDRLFLFGDVHYGPTDEALRHKRAPIGLHEEILTYQFAPDPNRPEGFLPVPDKKRGFDDGCDALRYLCMDVFKIDRDMRPAQNLIRSVSPHIAMSGADEERLRAIMDQGQGTQRARYY